MKLRKIKAKLAKRVHDFYKTVSSRKISEDGEGFKKPGSNKK